MLPSCHMASFSLPPAALLNKSECLASVLSHTYPCSSVSASSTSSSTPSPSPHAQLQKRQTPTVDSAHVQRLIQIVMPWWRGTVLPFGGVCRHEVWQGAFKEPGPQKRKQMAAGITPLRDCTCFPHTPLSRLLFNQCPENSLGALKWKNVSMLGLYTAAGHMVPADSCAALTHFQKQENTIHVYGPDVHFSIVVVPQTSDWR